MKQILKLVARFYLLGALFFFVARALFYYTHAYHLSISEWLSAALHGLVQDVSVLSYWGILLLLLHLIFSRFSSKITLGIQHILFGIAALFLSINARLYEYWNYHIDAQILTYLKTPSDAFASVIGRDVVFTVVFLIALCLTYVFGNQYFGPKWTEVRFNLKTGVYAVLVLALLGIPARGGVSKVPMTVSAVYHDASIIGNHTAVNPVWNLLFSFTKQQFDYWVLSDEEAKDALKSISLPGYAKPAELEINDSTNVVLVVIESMSANVVSSFGGVGDMSPNLDNWFDKGISFTSYYASGDRSDRGLTAMLTGCPAVPYCRLLQHPRKLIYNPNITADANYLGYTTRFYYGGNASFANIRLLFEEANVDHMIEESSFGADVPRGKWGVQDQDVYNKLLDDIRGWSGPQFSTLFTLSSHEPFDHPGVSYQSDSFNNNFYKSIYYADSCLGAFLNSFSKLPQWKNTLVVVTADHGSKKPNDYQIFEPEKYRIPLLFLGGAVKSSKTYQHTVGQCDLPYTLSVLMRSNFLKNPYTFSKNLFDTTNSFATYYYHVGAGVVKDTSCLVYDYKAGKTIYQRTENENMAGVMRRQLIGYSQEAARKFESH